MRGVGGYDAFIRRLQKQNNDSSSYYLDYEEYEDYEAGGETGSSGDNSGTAGDKSGASGASSGDKTVKEQETNGDSKVEAVNVKAINIPFIRLGCLPINPE